MRHFRHFVALSSRNHSLFEHLISTISVCYISHCGIECGRFFLLKLHRHYTFYISQIQASKNYYALNKEKTNKNRKFFPMLTIPSLIFKSQNMTSIKFYCCIMIFILFHGKFAVKRYYLIGRELQKRTLYQNSIVKDRTPTYAMISYSPSKLFKGHYH